MGHETNCLFGDIQGAHQYYFVAAFHCGVPLSIAWPGSLSGWRGFGDRLEHECRKKADTYRSLQSEIDFNANNRFPLGDPLVYTDCGFEDKLGLGRLLAERGMIPSGGSVDRVHNYVLVCPSGVLLFVGVLSTSMAIPIEGFEDVVESQYDRLRKLFLDFVPLVYDVLKKCRYPMSSSLFPLHDLERIRREMAAGDEPRADPLLDIYYMEAHSATGKDDCDVGYVHTIMNTDDRLYAALLIYAYCSFVSFIWVMDRLNKQSQVLLEEISGSGGTTRNAESSLKLFRVFCVKLISESNPILIRLTRQYLGKLEEFWRASRMSEMAAQIAAQIDIIDDQFAWLEARRRERWTNRISLAAVFLSLISISAVVAQIISTVDVTMEIGKLSRVSWIVVGSLGGIGLVLLGFLPALFRRR